MRRLLVCCLIASAGFGEDSDDTHLRYLASQLSVGAASMSNARAFVGRPCVVQLLIADTDALEALESVLEGTANWSAKASALYVLHRTRQDRRLTPSLAKRLFEQGPDELRAFVVEVIDAGARDEDTGLEEILSWRERAESEGTPALGHAREILAALPDFTEQEVLQRVHKLLPPILKADGANLFRQSGSPRDRGSQLLGEMGERVVPYLGEALGSTDSHWVRIWLIRTLGHTQSNAAALILRELLRDPSEDVRQSAMYQYARCAGRAAIPDLQFLLASDPSARVRSWADEHIKNLEGRSAPDAVSRIDEVPHPTPGEWLVAHREVALEETRKANAEWNQGIQEAIEEHRRSKESAAPRVLSPDENRANGEAGPERRSLLMLATALIGTVALLLIGWRIFVARRARAS